MMRASTFAVVLLAFIAILCGAADCSAGMPAVLASGWTADKPGHDRTASPIDIRASDAQFQAISFFLACLFGAAWVVKGLWNSVRGDFQSLPVLSSRRALGFVVLWGLCFVIILTMISGARELMTPGAWRKQGWTYTLAEPKVTEEPNRRQQALERLRFALWQYAATHQGQFPPDGDSAIEHDLWQLPGVPGLEFLYVTERSVDEAGQLLVYEPALNDDDRLVLLTNGFVGTMRTADIERLLATRGEP
jgi:hypothetical protein